MPAIPAKCVNPSCGFEFPSGLVINGGGPVGIGGNIAECPRCGAPALAAEGYFTFYNGAIQVVAASPETRAMIERFQGIVARASSGEISQEQAVEEVERLNPALVRLFSLASQQGLSALLLLATIIQTYLMYDANRGSDESNSKMLSELSANRAVIEEILKAAASKQNDLNDTETGRGKPPQAEAHIDGPITKKASPRRADVNRQRRSDHRLRRKQFGGSHSMKLARLPRPRPDPT